MLELDDQLSLHAHFACRACLRIVLIDFFFYLMRTSGNLPCFSETITCVGVLTEDYWGWKLHLTWVIGSILKFSKIN